MSEEHYPAHSVGNDDIVALDIAKMFDRIESVDFRKTINQKIVSGENIEKYLEDLFDNDFSKSLYPKGRTAKTLCKYCNTFLGKYDEAYLKFFKCDGDPKQVKGFQEKTKLYVVKSIFGKFLSVPETYDETFDFVDFVKTIKQKNYQGEWNIFFVRRDFSTDLMGFKDLRTGSLQYDEGVVYELSDDKFIFNLMNFRKHDCYKMTNLFDIMNRSYSLVTGVGELGGYHAQIMISDIFKEDKSLE